MEAGLFVYGRNETGLSIMESFVGEYEPYTELFLQKPRRHLVALLGTDLVGTVDLRDVIIMTVSPTRLEALIST